ncbi:RNA polymerase sigma factor [Singulisphaera acidiphila]|uniref:RNA polymerase sigma factor, sigma-70 family n=1 Tax=Singulisphaera acidiphila (strain ATCC BAA-1392 / DSM 18658 / VKM B-2454 / MOB10) TaxID=886293 RepID=L0DF65_SINAD|nr:sigma-70 family RNA polymerase sigma factor [Singulisphaera acidiphila]AGA27495.1 RNA polymerase sigma factor, sigma-70 family [Singulisphaera acidiphila DSM 18658]
MDESPATRDSLIVKLRDPADSTAWREFVALYEPLVYRLARRKGLQDADAHDICQEVFRAVAGASDRWDPARGNFRGWLSRIARNLLINFLARRQYQLRGSGATSVQDLLEAQPAVDPSATALFEAEYEKRLFRWAADDIRGEFTPATWRAFWQTALEGRPPGEVAAELGLSVGAVYVARSRVLSRLRRRIEQCGDQAAAIINEVDCAFPAEPL